MALKAVLFDLLGTILDERSDYDALDTVMREVRDKYGLERPVSDLSGEFSLAIMDMIHGEAADDGLPAEYVPFEKAARDVFVEMMDAFGFRVDRADVDWFWGRYLDIQRRSWRLYPEAADALKEVKGMGLHVGVVTDADRYLAGEALPILRAASWVDAVTCSEEVGFPKPHPAIFEAALKKAGVRPGEAAMIGDSFGRDIEGAMAAGIAHVILVDRHDARNVDVEKVRDLRRVPRIVTDWMAGT
ncbi:MAG: HAD-IA family hydrolase [Euryarchaeota archaeon]|nr:HAD-IA family hydrolase [Euryarchaeota archaeon]